MKFNGMGWTPRMTEAWAITHAAIDLANHGQMSREDAEAILDAYFARVEEFVHQPFREAT